jgi:hypothetical protein
MNRMRLGALGLVVLGLGLLGLGRIDVLGQSPPAPAADPAAEIQAAYKEMEAKLVAELSAPEAWADEKQMEKTLKLIETAGVIRSEKAIPVLVEHLAWGPQRTVGFSPGELSTVQAAIVKIGSPALPALVEVLSGPTPDKSTKNQAENRIHLAADCMIWIFGPDDHGVEMTFHRIRLELAASKGDTKERLEYVMKLLRIPAETK